MTDESSREPKRPLSSRAHMVQALCAVCTLVGLVLGYFGLTKVATPPTIALPTVTATATVTVSAATGAQPGASDTPSGSLIVTIRPNGSVASHTWRVGATVGASADVVSSLGQLDRGCQIQWALQRGGQTVDRSTSGHCRSGGITPYGSPPLESGHHTLIADATTDSGQTGHGSYEFDVVE